MPDPIAPVAPVTPPAPQSPADLQRELKLWQAISLGASLAGLWFGYRAWQEHRLTRKCMAALATSQGDAARRREALRAIRHLAE